VKTALDIDSWLHNSTVLGARRENKKSSLVTITALCLFTVAQGMQAATTQAAVYLFRLTAG
jgi:hypothetical protein